MIVLTKEDVEVHLNANQTMTEHVCVWANCHLENLYHS
jgi:hypothetical protein